ncbi:MAG: tRNA (adenosine(37)-N6)-dimethylallyltransferase MiaA [Patescibacteria group bacterium]
MNSKLLVICGPTATGKTNLAGHLAKKFNGELVSADSRQVFKGMDIGTGKDYIKGVKIWGYDLISPKKDFSISVYLKFAKKAILDIARRGKLPILVGGTGFYIKGVVDGIPTVLIPQNEDFRKNFENKSVEDLFEMLAQIDPSRAGQMNTSDKKNPRRLIRAIEVATWKLEHGDKKKSSAISHQPLVLMVGLTSSKNVLERKIYKRVEERIKMGIKKEIQDLLNSGVDWDDQSMQALGYRQWRDYFEGGVPEEVVINEWAREEKKYAKRQLTWFRKDMRIKWFDIAADSYPGVVESLVKKWYSSI